MFVYKFFVFLEDSVVNRKTITNEQLPWVLALNIPNDNSKRFK